MAFVVPLVALLMSKPMMWHEEHLWNVSVLQSTHLSNLVLFLMMPNISDLIEPSDTDVYQEINQLQAFKSGMMQNAVPPVNVLNR
jgi:hypothetical protein